MSATLETRQELRPVSGEMFSVWIETLETRKLLSATGQIVMQPALSLSPAASGTTVQGYTPQQIKKAYGFDSLTLDNGLGSSIVGDGAGQTIAIVDAYDHPNILNDLKTFDQQFSLAEPPSFLKVSQNGSKTALPKADAGWGQEIALDVEWAHAIAPKANILLVEAKSAGLGDLLQAVDYARHAAGVSVVSMSWGSNEFYNEGNYDTYFTTPAGHQGVSFVASAGDEGSWYGASWPAVSSNVLAVGGTTLRIGDASGTYNSETGWSGSGGGLSAYIPEPAYQSQFGNLGSRGAPDVSLNANPYTGYAVYDSFAYQGQRGWQTIGGTSAGAPQWAALIAVANQGRSLNGAGTLDGATGTLPAIYSLYHASSYSSNFNDVSLGASSFFIGAHAGWDAVTGLGSPKGDPIVDALAGFGVKAKSAKSSPAIDIATATKKSIAQPEFERVVARPPSLPAAKPVGSIFRGATIASTMELVANVTTVSQSERLSTGGTINGASGSSSFDADGAGSRHAGQVRNIHPRLQGVSGLSRSVAASESDANFSWHATHDRDEASAFASPNRIFSPSHYNFAAGPASDEERQWFWDWKQLAAVLGAGVLVASYSVEANRKKRAAMSIWGGIQSER